ncbi:hypothetical protein D9753_31190 [Streptomyces dangxiongensis]|uniref:Uncharacterized protein n=1 Tax=Streptomyces dangxiongensis TaxID=1442032 RepID=A0A3G2JJJ7_9ACTN|nr:hypothetical protein [Streptomyces dangxiongensis]AYN42610.1 hypothetical protein D9753_31190 [Streptomyces dangxiongensis]
MDNGDRTEFLQLVPTRSVVIARQLLLQFPDGRGTGISVRGTDVAARQLVLPGSIVVQQQVLGPATAAPEAALDHHLDDLGAA